MANILVGVFAILLCLVNAAAPIPRALEENLLKGSPRIAPSASFQSVSQSSCASKNASALK